MLLQLLPKGLFRSGALMTQQPGLLQRWRIHGIKSAALTDATGALGVLA
jgi:hypothetical protein